METHLKNHLVWNKLSSPFMNWNLFKSVFTEKALDYWQDTQIYLLWSMNINSLILAPNPLHCGFSEIAFLSTPTMCRLNSAVPTCGKTAAVRVLLNNFGCRTMKAGDLEIITTRRWQSSHPAQTSWAWIAAYLKREKSPAAPAPRKYSFSVRRRVNFHGRDLVRAEASLRTRSVLSAVFQGLNEAQLWPLDGGQTEYIENAHLLLHHYLQHHQLKWL